MQQLDLSAFFKTKAQATDFKSRIATLSEKVYQTNFDLEHEMMESFGLQKKDAFLTLIRDNNITVSSPKDIQAFLQSLIDTVTTFAVLSLTISFEPKESTLKTIAQWFLLNLKKQVLLDITVDPTIIAGATISFNGKYVDGSVKEKFRKALEQTLNASASKPSEPTSAPPAPTHQSIESMSMGR